MRNRTAVTAIALTGAVALLLGAYMSPRMSSAAEPSDEGAQAHDPVQGRALFLKHNCYGCHGGLAGGGMGPNLRKVGEKMSPEAIHDIILTGKLQGSQDKGMPSWRKKGMSSEETWHIVAYLQTLGKADEPAFFIGWSDRLKKAP